MNSSEKPVGPYRFVEVALPPREWNFFDARSTHNPHFRKVGDTFLLLYMGTNYDGPWERQPTPWRFRGQPAHVEDPFLWYEDGRVQALMKDMTGEICGEKFAGVHVTSPDGVTWDFDGATLAYRREVRWNDGHTSRQGFLERPQLLIEDAVPTHLFCATAEGPGIDLKDATRTWNIVFPLGKAPPDRLGLRGPEGGAIAGRSL